MEPELPFTEALRRIVPETSLVDRMLKEAPFGVYLDHPTRGCVYANRKLLELFGAEWEEFSGFGWASRVDPTDMERLRSTIEHYERTLEPVALTYRIKAPTPDAPPRWIQAEIRAIKDAAGKHVGSVGVSLDVSEQRQLLEQSVARQKMEAVGRLAARMAHDCNNLFGVILGCSSLLGMTASTEQRTHLQMIEDAIDRASALTTQLLILSRRRQRSSQVCCVDDELGRLLPMVRRTLGEGIQLEVALEAGEACVSLDRGELGQILLNLAVNGSDAMEGRGVLRVRTRRAGAQLQLEVEDTGCGMDSETAARALTAFFTTKPEGRGTGLGLSTVAELAEGARGQLELESEVGRGTRVTVELPVVTAEIYTEGSVPSGGAVPAPGGAVLLLEDQDDLRQTLAYALAMVGYEVHTASRLSEAREVAAAHALDALVVDVMLPDGLGTELVEELRVGRPKLPVVFSSGFTGDAGDALSPDGVTRFLEKPFRPRDLLDALATLLRAGAP